METLNAETANNSQQIKKDEDLIGKSSGDTNHDSGSKNDLKDLNGDNHSADTTHFIRVRRWRGKMSLKKEREDFFKDLMGIAESGRGYMARHVFDKWSRKISSEHEECWNEIYTGGNPRFCGEIIDGQLSFCEECSDNVQITNNKGDLE